MSTSKRELSSADPIAFAQAMELRYGESGHGNCPPAERLHGKAHSVFLGSLSVLAPIAAFAAFALPGGHRENSAPSSHTTQADILRVQKAREAMLQDPSVMKAAGVCITELTALAEWVRIHPKAAQKDGYPSAEEYVEAVARQQNSGTLAPCTPTETKPRVVVEGEVVPVVPAGPVYFDAQNICPTAQLGYHFRPQLTGAFTGHPEDAQIVANLLVQPCP